MKVQRQVEGGWVDFADQSGEIPVTVEYPQGEEVQSYLEGNQHWQWTAHFEAFASNFDLGMGGGARDTAGRIPLRGGRPAPAGRQHGCLTTSSRTSSR